MLGVHGDRRARRRRRRIAGHPGRDPAQPEDLTIVGTTASDRAFDWLKWLPHVRSVTSPLAGNHVVHTHDDASLVVARLVEVAGFRSSGGERDDELRCWPRILLLLDADLAPDAVEVSRLLDVGRESGISVIWLAGSLAGVPRQASQILGVRKGDGAAMVGRLWSTDPDVPDREIEVEHLRTGRADRAAAALAPVRDASTASLATSIPRAPRCSTCSVSACRRRSG